MAKDAISKETEIEKRLDELRQERADIARGLEQIETQIGSAAAAGVEPDQLAELQRERALDRQRLEEIDLALPTLDRQLVDAREAAHASERKGHLRAAWELAAMRAEIAGAIDTKLAEVGELWSELVKLTAKENAALQAAGAGIGSGTTMQNRLHWLIPAVLWRHCSAMLAAARFERVPSSRWQTLASFVSQSNRSNAA